MSGDEITCFSQNGRRFAAIDGTGVCRITWDTEEPESRQNLPVTALKATPTCIAWACDTEELGGESTAKLLVGTSKGAHILVNPALETSKSLGKHAKSKKSITSLVSQETDSVISIDAAGGMMQIDVPNEEVTLERQAPVRNPKTCTYRSTDETLFVVSSTARAYSLNEDKWTSDFDAHCGTPKSAVCTNDFAIVVARERLLTVFKCPGNKFNDPSKFGVINTTATLASEPKMVDAIRDPSENIVHVLVVLENGSIQHFQIKPKMRRKKRKNKGLTTSSDYYVEEAEYPLVKNVMSGCLTSGTEGTISCRVAYHLDGEIHFFSTQYGNPSQFTSPADVQPQEPTVDSAESSSASALATVSSAHPDAAEVIKRRKRNEANKTIGTRALEAASRIMDAVQEEDDDEVTTGGTAPSLKTSVSSALQQALHSNDEAMLERCLLSATTAQTIDSTIAKLEPQYVMPLVNRLVAKFEAKPTRGPLLLSWMKSVLTIHTAHLMSTPELLSKLLGLYQTINGRVSVYEKLLRLEGRLDLLLSHVNRDNADGNVKKSGTVVHLD
eukprot:gb/GECG01002403.1/.p1 GENE.gb/GECG01002403.1/~~gb/GECG01002403.1/.p1  ORF type:complete len:555 (+),score=73.41 gb/GECG01002403.1/:1-1665(+)